MAQARAILRDVWLVLGIALVLLVALELAYRAQGAARRALFAQESGEDPARPQHPYADEEWWEAWTAGAGGWQTRFDPYRALWSEPREGLYLSIDSLGRRRTVQPALSPSDVRARVYLLGGSTMFGYTSRDEGTIPSQLAALLAEAGVAAVDLVNLAQSTFNVTQGLNTLALELRDGRVPDVVAFLDGNNEIAPVFQGGQPGEILNQELVAERVRGGERSMATLLVRSLTFVERLRRLVERGASAGTPPAPRDPRLLCGEIVDTYFGAVSVVDALATAYGFEAFFFWQPMLAITNKEVTPFERSVRTSEDWTALIRECTRLAISEAELRGMDGFVSLASVFDDWAESVFLDDYAHVTEEGNRRIAEAMLEPMMPVLLRRVQVGRDQAVAR